MGTGRTLHYDHYKVLGIERNASLFQVKRAYRERVKHCHPDVNPSPRAALVFHAVHEAYRVLSDSGLREDYDARLRYYKDAAVGSTPPAAKERKTSMPFGFRRPEGPPTPFQKLVFRGLHITGLVFSTCLITGILIGVVFFSWPLFTLAFCIAGIALIPDSINGLRG
jgi:curved DNA-binding protein CbpA